MTPIEAYELTLSKIGELKQEGIKVKITPSRSREDEEIVKEFDGHFQRIPADKWLHVSFESLTIEQANIVNGISTELGTMGIRFDTGGFGTERDWELDWSFKFTGEDEKEWKESKNEVEEMIKVLNEESAPHTEESGSIFTWIRNHLLKK